MKFKYIIILTLLFLFWGKVLSSQGSRVCVENSVFVGVNGIESEGNSSIDYSYMIFNNTEVILFSTSYPEDFEIFMYGFSESSSRRGVKLPQDIRESGKGMVLYNVGDENPKLVGYTSCDESTLLFQRPPELERKQKIENYDAYSILWAESQKRSRDLFEEFMYMIVKRICVEELNGYNTIDGTIIDQLGQNELVAVIETQGDWVQVYSLARSKVYWTYSSCLE